MPGPRKGRYKLSLVPLFMTESEEVLGKLKGTGHQDIGATLKGLLWPNMGQYEHQKEYKSFSKKQESMNLPVIFNWG